MHERAIAYIENGGCRILMIFNTYLLADKVAFRLLARRFCMIRKMLGIYLKTLIPVKRKKKSAMLPNWKTQ